MIKVSVCGDPEAFNFIVVENNGIEYFSQEIDQILLKYSSLSYEEIALKFGAYIDDSYGDESIEFENKEDAIRCRNFLEDLFK